MEIRRISYNIETNEYLFLHDNSIYSLLLTTNDFCLDDSSQFIITTEQIISIPSTQGDILHFSLNNSYIVLMIKDASYKVNFYSLYTHEYIFSSVLENLVELNPYYILPTKF